MRAEDIETIIAQERALVLPEFDEHVAFALGAMVQKRAADEKLGIACGLRTWDRPLFYVGLPGSTADNEHWIRRKSNTVMRMQRSSYRCKLEFDEERTFPPHRNLPIEEFALSGGSFPIRVKGAGIVGAMTVSGLHERVDHEIVVAALCEHLGLAKGSFALPPLE